MFDFEEMPVALQELWWIVRKELTCCYRDQDVLIYGLIFPVVLYPLLFLFAFEGIMWSTGTWEKSRNPICVVGETANSHFVTDALKSDTHLILMNEQNPDESLKAGTIKAVISYNPPSLVTIKTHEPATELIGLTETLEYDIRRAHRESIDKELQEKHVPESVLTPFYVSWQSTKPTAQGAVRSLGLRYIVDLLVQSLLIYTVFVMILVAQVASICLLVEEKEKKTFDTTMLLPISRTKIMVAKFLTVNVAIASSVVLHLLSLAVNSCFAFLAFGIVEARQNPNSYVLRLLTGQAHLQLSDVVVVWYTCVKMLPMLQTEIQLPSFADIAFIIYIIVSSSALAAASFLFASSFGKSNKDAQTLALFPTLLLFSVTSISLMPGLDLNLGTALLPLSNLLIMRKFPRPELIPGFLTIFLSLVLPVLFLWAAKKVFFNDYTSRRRLPSDARVQP
jgi:sodium transport system permease protein